MNPVLPVLLHDRVILAVVHVLTAGAVTMHVLIRKRSVRAAIGWIGLAWLSPVLGAVLYYVLGINRVTRRALRLRRAVGVRGRAAETAPMPALADNIAVIAGVVERLTGRALVGGNDVAVLRSGDEAYPAMLSAIGRARHSVALSSYIFRADDVGRSFVEALAEARSRGVQIRVLIDGVGGGYMSSSVARSLKRQGVPVARFLHHWLPWRMPYLNMRNHKKILVVDGMIGFTGGLNIGNESVLANRARRPVHDVHFRIRGPVVRHLMETFAEDWNFTTGETLRGDAWWPLLCPSDSVWARGISSGPDEAVGRLEAAVATAISAAKRRLRIVTPYFLPDEQIVSAIALAALRGVSVEIVMPEHSDHAPIDWASRAQLSLLAPDIRAYLAPQPFSHAKLMTVDGAWCLIGTANWDVRSMRLNFEFNLECYTEALTAQIDRIIDSRIEGARRVSQAALAKRPLPYRLRDAAARLLLPYL